MSLSGAWKGPTEQYGEHDLRSPNPHPFPFPFYVARSHEIGHQTYEIRMETLIPKHGFEMSEGKGEMGDVPQLSGLFFYLFVFLVIN